MNAKVTRINPPREASDFRKASNRFTVYTDGKARNVADREYFTKHEIFNLEFRCASWNKVANFATDIEAAAARQAIEAEFGVKVELKFSRKAGCSCGCSPGYIGTILEASLDAIGSGKAASLKRASVWVEEEISAEDEAAIAAFAAKQALKLPAEIIAGNAKVAAEKAAQEAQRAADRRENEERQARWAARETRWAQERMDESLASACL